MIVNYSPIKDVRSIDYFTPNQAYTAIAYVSQGGWNILLAIDNNGTPTWHDIEQFKIPDKVNHWPMSRRWTAGSGTTTWDGSRWYGFGYRSLIENGSEYINSLIERTNSDIEAEARIEGMIERARDTLLAQIHSWSTGELTYLEISRWAEEALDGSIAKMLDDNPEVVMILAELMSLDKEPHQNARATMTTQMINRI